MKKVKPIGEYEHVICAYAQHANGPGWANGPLWYIVRNKQTGVLREECLQPNEQSIGLHLVYNIAEGVHRVLTSEIEKLVKRR